VRRQPPRRERLALAGFLWLALFSILYTAGERRGVWPALPPGAFRDWDLAIGGLGAAALVLALSAGRPAP
jgi:hypothetical protein